MAEIVRRVADARPRARRQEGNESAASAIFQVRKELPGGIGVAAHVLLSIVTDLGIVGWRQPPRGAVTAGARLVAWTEWREIHSANRPDQLLSVRLPAPKHPTRRIASARFAPPRMYPETTSPVIIGCAPINRPQMFVPA